MDPHVFVNTNQPRLYVETGQFQVFTSLLHSSISSHYQQYSNSMVDKLVS